LILGEPGAGKTTLLLELARTLLQRAEQEEFHRLPVVFNLSSWPKERQPLADWLVKELWTKYQVSQKIGQNWLNLDLVLPLLDGLDELEENARPACVQAINAYHQRRLEKERDAALVVCCRHEEYMALSTRVMLQQAVTIQPLTDVQIECYLRSAQGQLEGLRQAIHQDKDLYELAQRPLMLSIFTLAYQGVAPEDFPTGGTSGEQQHQVFATYVECMLTRRGVPKHISREQMLEWLTFLAVQARQHHQTLLFLVQRREFIQKVRDSIRQANITNKHRWISNWLIPLVLYLTLLFVTGGPASVLAHTLAVVLITIPSLVLAYVLYYWLTVKPSRILSTEVPIGSWRQAKERTTSAPAIGVIVGMLVGFGGLLFWGDIGLSMKSMLWPIVMMVAALIVTLVITLVVGLVIVLSEFMQPFTLRFWLWHAPSLPWKRTAFLDEAVDRLLLRRVGGGYIFIHRLLLDYFASLKKKEL
ncbi:MAG: NACHT domain-containing protein, partial [Ktedonobacteraceae bacterium]